MLNTATMMMMDSTQNITVCSTTSAENSAELLACQSFTTAMPASFWRSGSRMTLARSGLSVTTSIIPTASSSRSSVCASSNGITTNALS